MLMSQSLEQDAHRIYDEEVARLAHRPPGAGHRHVTDSDLEVCPLRFMLRDLLLLLSTQYEQPVRMLEPTVRRLILERNFMDCGDACVPTERRELIDRHVELALRVLERVRRQAHHSGQWCDLPATPQMFG